MNFSKQYVMDAITDLQFTTFTDIQKAVIPTAIKKRDIIASSATGTGKTHAFLLPVFERLDEKDHSIQAVIISPTRELATQIYHAAVHIASFSDAHLDIRLYTGGKDRDKEISRLKKSQPHIVIGTPGKIKDLAIQENVLKVYKAKMLIIDEADMALEIGFLEDIDMVARTMTAQLQMLVFSATIPEALKPFLHKYMKNPKEIILQDKSLHNLDVTHTFIRTNSQEDKEKKFLETINQLNPYLCMIFANTKEEVERLSRLLFQQGENVISLHGDIKPRKRKQIIKDINRLTYQYIIASDIASRGLDIDGVSHIINYDLPKDMSFYIHRIGRTGRMGRSGEAISFFTDKDTHAFTYINKYNIDANIIGRQVNVPNKPKKKR